MQILLKGGRRRVELESSIHRKGFGGTLRTAKGHTIDEAHLAYHRELSGLSDAVLDEYGEEAE